eukprot:g9406.t1
MTAAGQAMVVLVPIREKSAMTYINDTDAKLMGIVDEEKERLAQVDENMKKEQQRKASDLAELREARKELRKSKDKAMPKEATCGSRPSSRFRHRLHVDPRSRG